MCFLCVSMSTNLTLCLVAHYRNCLSFCTCNAGFVVDGQEVGVFLVWRFAKWVIFPQIWCQVSVGLGDGSVCCLGEVTQSTGGATGRGVAIFNTSHQQQFLWNWSWNDASTTWSWDQTHWDWTALASNLIKDKRIIKNSSISKYSKTNRISKWNNWSWS